MSDNKIYRIFENKYNIIHLSDDPYEASDIILLYDDLLVKNDPSTLDIYECWYNIEKRDNTILIIDIALVAVNCVLYYGLSFTNFSPLTKRAVLLVNSIISRTIIYNRLRKHELENHQSKFGDKIPINYCYYIRLPLITSIYQTHFPQFFFEYFIYPVQCLLWQ